MRCVTRTTIFALDERSRIEYIGDDCAPRTDSRGTPPTPKNDATATRGSLWPHAHVEANKVTGPPL
jgi:hypothetical protein